MSATFYAAILARSSIQNTQFGYINKSSHLSRAGRYGINSYHNNHKDLFFDNEIYHNISSHI